jgi:heme exporter protein A
MPSAEGAARLAARGLACARGGRLLFRGVDLDAGPGDVVQVRGRNGSGKSSLLAVLSGLLRARAGEVRWRGRAVAPGDPGYAHELAYLGHADGLSTELTGRENLRLALVLAGTPSCGEACESLLARLRLTRPAALPVQRLSQGQRRRLALARVVLSARPLWLLDEPHAGLDAEGIDLLEEELLRHARAGGIAVVSTHGDLACGYGQSLQLDGDADAGSPGLLRPA